MQIQLIAESFQPSSGRLTDPKDEIHVSRVMESLIQIVVLKSPDGKGPWGRAVERAVPGPAPAGLKSLCPFLSSSPGLALQEGGRQSGHKGFWGP